MFLYITAHALFVGSDIDVDFVTKLVAGKKTYIPPLKKSIQVFISQVVYIHSIFFYRARGDFFKKKTWEL